MVANDHVMQWVSRVTIKNTKHFGTIARRLYRIFAFCFHTHRELFDDFEVSSVGLDWLGLG